MQKNVLCKSRRELSNAYLLAEVGFDTAENEPSTAQREAAAPNQKLEAGADEFLRNLPVFVIEPGRGTAGLR